jgi:hypothetical protein
MGGLGKRIRVKIIGDTISSGISLWGSKGTLRTLTDSINARKTAFLLRSWGVEIWKVNDKPFLLY